MTYEEYLKGRVIITGDKVSSLTGRHGSGDWEHAKFTEREFKMVRMVEPSMMQALDDIHKGMCAGKVLGGGLMNKVYTHANGFKDDFIEYTGSYLRFRTGATWMKDITLLPTKIALISEISQVISRIGYNKVLVEGFITEAYNDCMDGFIKKPASCKELTTSLGVKAKMTTTMRRVEGSTLEVSFVREGKRHANSLFIDSHRGLKYQLETLASLDAVVDNAFIWELIHTNDYKYPLGG